MGVFLGGTEYCPSSLGGTLNLKNFTPDKNENDISFGV